MIWSRSKETQHLLAYAILCSLHCHTECTVSKSLLFDSALEGSVVTQVSRTVTVVIIADNGVWISVYHSGNRSLGVSGTICSERATLCANLIRFEYRSSQPSPDHEAGHCDPGTPTKMRQNADFETVPFGGKSLFMHTHIG